MCRNYLIVFSFLFGVWWGCCLRKDSDDVAVGLFFTFIFIYIHILSDFRFSPQLNNSKVTDSLPFIYPINDFQHPTLDIMNNHLDCNVDLDDSGADY
jgi:hypothetical protein